MSRGPCASRALDRALAASCAAAGTTVEVSARRASAWQSATFAGMRHELEASAPSGGAIDRWLEAVPAADWPMRGHLLADARVAALERAGATTRFTLSILTVAAG